MSQQLKQDSKSSIDFLTFATLCQALEGESSRLKKIEILAEALKTMPESDLAPCMYLIRGAPFPEWSQETLGIGPNLLYEAIAYVSGIKRDEVIRRLNIVGDIGSAACELLEHKSQTSFFFSSLTLHDVYMDLVNLSRITGDKSQREKLRVIQGLLSAASPLEGRYLVGILLGDVRIGTGEGTVREALARAFDVRSADIDFAFQVRNDLGEVALLCLKGEEALRQASLTLYHPVRMMLARQGSIAGVLEASGEVAVEYKYDGARFQFHLGSQGCKIYSRRLEDVTDSLPDIAQALTAACTDEVILDGEAIAIDKEGRPLPFQTVLRRFRRKHGVQEAVQEVTLIPRIFDILYHNGELLITHSCRERRIILTEVLKDHVTPRIESGDEHEIEKHYHDALDNGHEGVMLKLLDSAYTPGIRGKDWIKVKPQPDSLDLIIIGAEWGEGRRGKLFGSFLVACRDDESSEKLVPISKVATGFTDQDLEDVYTELKDQIIGEDRRNVILKPQLVLEVGYSEIQMSPTYEGGFALRFPRLLQIRRDKGVFDINSLADIARRYEGQIEKAPQHAKEMA
jgi:DNA ligase-1